MPVACIKNGQMQVVCIFVCPRTSSSRRSASSKPTYNYENENQIWLHADTFSRHCFFIFTNRCEFTGTIIDQFANANMASKRGDRCDVSSFILDHFGQKRFCGLLAMTRCYYIVYIRVCLCVCVTYPKVCHNIHIERSLDQMVRCIQQMQPRHDAGIVDQQCHLYKRI